MPRIEEKAVDFVLDFEKKRTGCDPIDVSRKRSIIGYDVLSMDKNSKIDRTIEVKGTRKGYAIPDAAETEFTRNLTLIATHLYVIGNLDNPNSNPILYIIPRKDMKKEYLSIKRTIHFSTTFQKLLPKNYREPT